MLTDNPLDAAVCYLSAALVCGLLCKAWRFFAAWVGFALLLFCFTFFWMNGGNWGWPSLGSVSETVARLNAARLYEVLSDSKTVSAISETLGIHLHRGSEHAAAAAAAAAAAVAAAPDPAGTGGWSLFG